MQLGNTWVMRVRALYHFCQVATLLDCVLATSQLSFKNLSSLNVFHRGKMLKRGALIVFEGCDRSGKTTQCQQVLQWFQQQGKPARFIRFPGSYI